MGAVLLAAVVGCNKNESLPSPEREEGAISQVNLCITTDSGSTKAVGTAHNRKDEFNAIGKLDVFVFASNGELDTYKSFSASEITFNEDLSSVEGLKLTSKTGEKQIYAVANAHNDALQGVKSLTDFSAACSKLKDENLESFVMTGHISKRLDDVADVTIPVHRLVARIVVESIRTSFTGTRYQGQLLSNVSLFLTNVKSQASYATGEGKSPLFNEDKEENNDLAMANMLSDDLQGVVICDDGYETSHYFYCYENASSDPESDDNKYTRLVIKADLDGKTYYYPVQINREGFGWKVGNSENVTDSHKGVKANCSYSINVIIKGRGASTPDGDVAKDEITVDIKPRDWFNVFQIPVVF